MIKRFPTNCNDASCPACVVAGDFIFLAHHAGGISKSDIKDQMRASFENMKKTLNLAGAEMNDMVQINLYLRHIEDFDKVRDIFFEYFDKNNFPVRMTTTTEFINKESLCMIDGTAYKPRNSK